MPSRPFLHRSLRTSRSRSLRTSSRLTGCLDMKDARHGGLQRTTSRRSRRFRVPRFFGLRVRMGRYLVAKTARDRRRVRTAHRPQRRESSHMHDKCWAVSETSYEQARPGRQGPEGRRLRQALADAHPRRAHDSATLHRARRGAGRRASCLSRGERSRAQARGALGHPSRDRRCGPGASEGFDRERADSGRELALAPLRSPRAARGLSRLRSGGAARWPRL